ncbi:MAG: DUF362 domain-containing protein [Bacilli bacterium]|nr:DUF362 domain-containing protein [Bacilli bacterium]
MTKVVLTKCEEYNLDLIKQDLRSSLSFLGGLESFIKKSDKVFIKLNCVGPFEAEKGITTHPVFAQAVIQLVKEITTNIIIGDNPATKDLTFTLKKNGLYDVIIAEGVEILDGRESTTIVNENCHIYNQFQVSKSMVDVDVMINLPKLKTHSLAYMTGAEKNLFGFIFGLNKAGWHVKASNPLEFGEAINDLYGAILNAFKDKKILHIMDGIIGLEGEGPSSGGITKKANAILMSTDAVSLDRVAVEVVHLDNKKLFINKIAGERGYGENNLENIEVLGNSIDDFADINFLPPKDSLGNLGLRMLRIKTFRNVLLEHPVVMHNSCIRCGECAKICPPKAMTIKAGEFPRLNKSHCIRCWCCSEVCPKNAIKKSRRPIIGKIVF